MNNLKTAVIVVLLLGALYGAYQFLNQRDVPPPPEVLAQQQLGIAPPTIEFGTPGFEAGPMPIPAGDSFTAPTFAPPAELTPPSTTPPSTTPPAAINTPSFSVLPDAAAQSKFTPPAVGTPRQETTPRPVDVTFHEPPAAPAVAPSAYTDSSVRAEAPANSAAAPSNDPFPGLQANPFYRANGAKPTATAAPASNAIARQTFERSWSEASRLVESGKFKEALAELTVFYDSPDLTAAENKQLLRTLDSLAGRVIYSTEHYLADAYVVRVDETLMDVAAKYNVPYQLLQNINGIRDPLVLSPKSKLKVVPGPFRADVSLRSGELALFVDKYYAGRFPISVGQDPVPTPGEYAVKMKRDGKDYYLPNGKTVPERNPSNPYGGHWIDLGKEVCIHGSAEHVIAPQLGCISLAPIDAADVYGILSVGSTVTIRR